MRGLVRRLGRLQAGQPLARGDAAQPHPVDLGERGHDRDADDAQGALPGLADQLQLIAAAGHRAGAP